MAQNPQDPKDTEKLKKELEDIVRMSSEMEFAFLRTRDASKALIETLTGSSEIVNRIGTFGTQIKNSFIDISQLASRLGTDYIKTEQVQKRIRENAGLQVELQTMQNKFVEEYNKKVAGTYTLNSKGEKITAKAVSLESARNFILEKAKQKGEASLEDQEKQFLILNQYIESLKEQEKVLSQIQSKVNDGNTEFTKMAVKGTALKKIFDQLSFIPFLSSFMRFDIIADKFLISKREGFDELGKQIKNIVTSPMFLLSMGLIGIVAAFKALVKLAFDFDKQLVKISNNLGFTRNSTIAILDNFREISDENRNIVNGLDSAFLSVKNQAAATAELQEILETNSMFTSKMIQTQILLTKQMGLSKEEAAGIQKLSLLSGKSADDILQNAIKQNNTAISYRKIISEISKVNSEISVMYKNNPDLIAKAVIQANKLGMSLEQTQRISKSLLDFESSIAGELEAELLLGKRFNFEKARALALDGKSAEAAKELLDQMGGLNGLTQLNVIQRDRLAASIGQSAEELTKAAREAEILNQLGFENKRALEEQYALLRERNDTAGISALMEQARKKEGGEILLQDIARADLQQRFQESVEKLKQVFTEIAAGPMIKMIEGLVKFLSNANTLKGVFIALAGLAAAIATSVIIATGGIAAITGGLAAAGTGYLLYREGSDTNYATPSPNLTSASVVPDVNRESTSFYSPNQSNMVPTTNAAVPNNTNPVEQMNTMASAKTATPSSLATQSNALASPAISLSEGDLLEKSSISYTAPRMGDNIMRSTMNNNSSVNNQMNNQNEYNQNNINNRDVAFNDKPAPIEANIYLDIDGIRVKEALMKLDRNKIA